MTTQQLKSKFTLQISDAALPYRPLQLSALKDLTGHMLDCRALQSVIFGYVNLLRDVAKLKKIQTSGKNWKWVGGSRAILYRELEKKPKKIKSLMIIGLQKKLNRGGGGVAGVSFIQYCLGFFKLCKAPK